MAFTIRRRYGGVLFMEIIMLRVFTALITAILMNQSVSAADVSKERNHFLGVWQMQGVRHTYSYFIRIYSCGTSVCMQNIVENYCDKSKVLLWEITGGKQREVITASKENGEKLVLDLKAPNQLIYVRQSTDEFTTSLFSNFIFKKVAVNINGCPD